ncbi:piezo-type mechanosensitive ion channel component 2-like [Salvelinus namaycush]|uniref:Piezo-type mechanosensitive ion channel component 2-like n=1 Tax=Salvelinus namaycush TaxID=8040 RepID=A0A8U1EMY2_SALNM|nr:piezo-type mechanosensitive ion channel component 2-like [Salvelinus namaycush]
MAVYSTNRSGTRLNLVTPSNIQAKPVSLIKLLLTSLIKVLLSSLIKVPLTFLIKVLLTFLIKVLLASLIKVLLTFLYKVLLASLIKVLLTSLIKVLLTFLYKVLLASLIKVLLSSLIKVPLTFLIKVLLTFLIKVLLASLIKVLLTSLIKVLLTFLYKVLLASLIKVLLTFLIKVLLASLIKVLLTFLIKVLLASLIKVLLTFLIKVLLASLIKVLLTFLIKVLLASLIKVCLSVSCLFRYNGLSFVYLIYLLLIPLFAEPTSTTMQGHTGRLLMSLCFSSLSFLLFHIIYQITVNSLLAGNNIDPAFNCSTWEKSIRQIGFESVIGADAGNGIRVFLPDIGMFLAGLACWLLCRSLFQKRPPEDMAQDNTDYEPEGEEEEEKLSPDDNVLLDEDFEAGYEAGEEEEEEMEEEEEEDEEEEEESNKMKILRHIAGVASKVKEIIGNLITTAGKVVVTILLGLTGITLPSLTSAVYFFVFLFLCTWWSFCRTFDTLIFSCMCVLMAIFSAGHLVVLYLYQFQFFQESIPPKDSYISLFGISSLIQTDCSSTWRMIVNPELAWHHFVNPIMLLLLYYTLATLIRLWLQEEPIEVGNILATFIRLWLQEPIEEPIEVGNILATFIRLWLQEPIEEGNTLENEEEEGEDGEEEEEVVGNGTGNSADKRRHLWWKANQRTEERNGLTAKSNGTSCDISTLNTVENRPVGLDLYSTPQYKMDQTNNITEKKNGSVFDVSPTVGGEAAGKEEEEEEAEQEEEEEEGRVNAVVTVFRFIMKQSYICALIAMMAWSITYVSWLTFVFLMWSCMLWMVRDRRRYTMLTSPFMVLYGNLLIVLQYIWSFELLEPVTGLFLKKDVPFSELGSKVLCLLSFWLLLRQTLTERKDKQREEDAVLTDVHVDNQPKKKDNIDLQVSGYHRNNVITNATISCYLHCSCLSSRANYLLSVWLTLFIEKEEDEEGGEQDIMQVLGNMVMEMLVKYWIYICGGMFFFVSFEGRMVMYKIIYMMLFLFCVALYQVHYEYWRRILKYFWMSVVVYTMLVLILVYTFQFDTSLPFWSNMTGMSKEKLKDLGLEQFSVSMLFTRIFIPTSFLLVCILHLHYFHDRFLLLTDLKAVAQKQDSTIYSHAKVNGRVYLIMNSEEQSLTGHSSEEQSLTGHSSEEQSLTGHSREEQSLTGHSSEEQSLTVHSSEEQSLTGHSSEEQSLTGHSSEEQSLTGHSSEEQSLTGHSSEEQSLTGHSSEEQSLTGHSSEEQSLTGHSSEEQSLTGHSSEEQSLTGHSSEEQSLTGHSSEEQSLTGHSSEEQSLTGHSREEQSLTGHSSEEQSLTGHSSEEQSLTGHSSEEQSLTGHSSEEQSLTGHSSEEQSLTGHSSAEQSLTGHSSEEQSLTGHSSEEQSLTGHSREEQSLTGHSSEEQSLTGHSSEEQSLTGHSREEQSLTGHSSEEQSLTGHSSEEQSLTGHSREEQSLTGHSSEEQSLTGHSSEEQSLTGHSSEEQSLTGHSSEEQSLTGHNLKNKWHLVVDRLTVLFLKFLEYFHKLQLFIWWLLEIHIIKIVSSYIILVSVKEVSLFNYVFMACWAFALPFSQFRPLASSICTVWTCVIIVCKMLYQLESIQPASYSKNCSMPMNYTEKQREEMKDSLLYKEPVDPSNWVGLNKFNPLLENLRNNLLMLAMLAFEVTIYRHQQYYRLRNKLTAPAARIIFHDITRQHLDNGIINCVKYFINYFFYKFGLETCFLLAVNVIGQRMDFYAMLHAFSLIAVMYRRRRKAIAEIWPKYCCFQACILTWQYFVCIGIPPAACKDYPWRFPNSAMDSNVIKWLYFPDFHTKPNPIFLVYDFMLLLCASLQGSIFDEENKAAVRLMAGDNVEICRDLDAASFSVHNPVPDFIHCRSYLDMLKVIMFSYLFWFVLTIIFITGTTRISLFCLGYLVGCFYFLLFGGELLLKPIKKILHYWDFLIAYNVFVITMKNILSILACGYINVLVVNSCWLIQLLSLACTIKEYKKCDLPKDEAGIIWDSICFAFLLLQRRVFMSYYFLHVVADIRASQILASRGAELFQATIVKAVRARLEEENKSMEQLKRQMDRIKQRQEKFKSGKKKMLSLAQESGDRENPIQPQESGDREEKEKVKETAKTKKRQWWRPWVDHASMVRSGDYYLFETDSEEEEEEEEKREDQELPKKSAFQRAIGKFASALIALPRSIIKLPKTILQYVIRAAKFVYHAWITDSKAAMKERSKEKRKFWKRYTKRDKHKKDKKKGHVTIEMEEDQEGTQKKKSDGPDNILKRVFNIIKFTWVLFQTMVESFTKWMNNVCREHIDISTVLRIERCMLTREVKKGNVPSRESIHMFYQKQMRMSMSRGSSLDRLSEEDSASGGSHRVRRRRGDYRMESQDSMASLASRDSISSAYTEATMLFSRQDTLDELDGMPSDVHIPKTSERARPKLRKIYGLDASKSTDSSSSQVSSETTQCITLYSRQGTTDTIEEVEDEQDQGEDRQHGPWGHPPPEGAEGAEDSPWRGGGDDGGGETTEERERYQGQGDPWGSPGPGEGPSFRVEEGASTLLALQQGSRPGSQDCTTDSDDGGVQDRQEYLNREERDRAGLLYTPDTDAPNTSDADVPPSYSKAVSFDRLEVSEDESDRDDNRMMAMTPDTSRSDYLDDPLLPSLTTELTASELLLNKMFHDEELERSERFYVGQPLVLQLVYALYNMLVAHSESVCYLVIILNNMLSASCVTLVLPILIFLWAMLSVPRPSKRFWMTAIVYTEVMDSTLRYILLQ